MSRAYDQGYEEATNVYGPLRSKDWHSLAHAEGWIYGLNCLIENYQITELDEYTTQEYLDEKIVDLELAIEETQKLIDQVEGGKDHKNEIQRLCKRIEELERQLEEDDEEFDDTSDCYPGH